MLIHFTLNLTAYSLVHVYHQYQVRSQGRDFTSLYWKDLSSSIFPLHTAVSNLCHYNSASEDGDCIVLQNVIQCLSELGCDFNATDTLGSTALHIALSICSERYDYLIAFISTLFVRRNFILKSRITFTLCSLQTKDTFT